jgi:predicted nuclease with TOPRIM domain
MNEYFHEMEIKLNKLTDQLRQTRQENDFNEIHLQQFQQELNRLTKELTESSNISIEEDSTTFISRISINVSGKDITQKSLNKLSFRDKS